MSLPRLLLHALDNHGPLGPVRWAIHRLRRLPPTLPREAPSIHPFDLAHSIDTSGFLPAAAIQTGSPADLYTTAYWAISPSSLAQALNRLPPALNPARFTFVDLGCGKGRALLVATHHGFASLLGVELSPALAAIAQTNLAHYPHAKILTADAATLLYPPAPLLIFLYHPFLKPLLRRVLKNLLAQRPPDSPPTYILFANPTYAKLFARFPAFTPLWDLSFSLTPEDAAADRHGITQERYTLYQLTQGKP